jgi:rhodanese-related sulfurtransferase
MTEVQDTMPDAASLPKGKLTSPGLYLTARQAYEKWKASPDAVKILDVRTPEELVFLGRPPMAWNVPLAVQTYQWDASGAKLPMKPNPGFLEEAKALFEPSDTLMVMCRSGGRSAMAVNLLAQAGFKNVYNIVDGMEGDVVDDPQSVYQGQRMRNGWKNSGLPCTYDLDPKKMCLPAEAAGGPPANP